MFDEKSTHNRPQPDRPAPATVTRATLYYDGRCPLCRREMALLAKHKDDRLRLRDIHRQWQFSASQREAMLRRLHFRQPDGQWLKGVDASVAAWRYTRWGRYLAVLRWRPLAPLVDWCYRRWAERRFRRLYGGGEALCRLPEEANNDA